MNSEKISEKLVNNSTELYKRQFDLQYYEPLFDKEAKKKFIDETISSDKTYLDLKKLSNLITLFVDLLNGEHFIIHSPEFIEWKNGDNIKFSQL